MPPCRSATRCCDARVRTVAFVNKRAISAGALIGLAAEKLVMADGGTIGAATPVQMGQPGAAAQPVEEKTVSYVRKEFRATAESRKRPPLLAEAMVDADVEIPGVIEKGKLLTLTTEEALKHKLIDFRADTMESVLEQLGLGGAELRRASPNWAENLVRFLTHPVVSSLLITIGMLGIIIELRTPGFGVAGGARDRESGAFLLGPLAGAVGRLGGAAACGGRSHPAGARDLRHPRVSALPGPSGSSPSSRVSS